MTLMTAQKSAFSMTDGILAHHKDAGNASDAERRQLTRLR